MNALHLKAASLVFGPRKLIELMSMEIIETGGTEETSNISLEIAERREIFQNLREGVISNFSDKETARQMILDMAEIEKLDRDHYMMLVGEIRGTARALRPKKRA